MSLGMFFLWLVRITSWENEGKKLPWVKQKQDDVFASEHHLCELVWRLCTWSWVSAVSLSLPLSFLIRLTFLPNAIGTLGQQICEIELSWNQVHKWSDLFTAPLHFHGFKLILQWRHSPTYSWAHRRANLSNNSIYGVFLPCRGSTLITPFSCFIHIHHCWPLFSEFFLCLFTSKEFNARSPCPHCMM